MTQSGVRVEKTRSHHCRETPLALRVADLHPSLCHLSNLPALTPRPTRRWVRYGETALDQAIPYFLPRPEKVPVTLGDENRGVNDSRPHGI